MHRHIPLLLFLLVSTLVTAQPAGQKPVPEKQQTAWLSFGDTKPRGWLLQQMANDLDHGFTGHLDKLVPDLIVADDIYGKDRLTREVKSKDVGAIKQDEAWEVQYLWWNSETQSNWWDGYVRNALLTGNEEAMRKTRQYVARMLSYQDADGYMGIYAPDLRYNFNGENGELWAQSTLFRALLAYYEATKDEAVLKAVERAVSVTMEKYSPASPPFKVQKPFGGVEHGLTITDTFDRLYQLTGKEKYLAYAHWLYQDFSQYPMSQDDAQYAHLVDPAYRFKAHGVHTYEHLRSVVTAYYASGDEQLQNALHGFLDKLDPCLTPSGGPIGDEWIGNRNADASETGYEYCSIHELLDSYSHLMQKSGDLSYGDRIEWLLFNAGQGARHPDGHSIAYLKTDNSFSMTGPLHIDAADKKQTRYKYSPAHQDAAVCCVPNAGRIYPYYTKAMWLRNDAGLVAALYGPSQVETSIGSAQVKIVAETQYPFALSSAFTISTSQPIQFTITFRKPAWATRIKVKSAGAAVAEKGNVVTVTKKWTDGDRINIEFLAAVREHADRNNGHYFSYGPLVYALPLPYQEKTGTREYAMPSFQDKFYTATENHHYAIPADGRTAFRFHQGKVNAAEPWATENYLAGKLWNMTENKTVTVRLVPMGATILRRVTFDEINKKKPN